MPLHAPRNTHEKGNSMTKEWENCPEDYRLPNGALDLARWREMTAKWRIKVQPEPEPKDAA